MPIEESCERYLFLATSARFPPASRARDATQLGDGVSVVVGLTGDIGSGVYSIG